MAKTIAWACLFCAVAANVVANSSIKAAVLKVPEGLAIRNLALVLAQPGFWIGVCLAGVVLGFYTVAIRMIPVSVAYMAITSLAMVGLVLVDRAVFDVTIGPTRIVGMGLIIFGVWLVSRGA